MSTIKTSNINNTEMSVIENRMKTIEDIYTRNNGINEVSNMTGLSYNRVQKVLSDLNFFHGIKRSEGTKRHPLKPIIFYNDYKFLLNADKIDSLRETKNV